MLDDQNDTIKHLKQNLDNKIRDQQSYSSSIQSKIEDLQDKLVEYKEKIELLYDELDSQRQSLGEEIRQEHRAEREEFKEQIGQLEQKLRDRNEAILKIEQEVRKVRKIFKQKEDKWSLEQNVLVQEKDDEILGLKHLLEIQTERSASKFEGERRSLSLTITDLQGQLAALLDKNQRLEDDIKIVLVELEKQKTDHALKMERIKSVFGE